LVRVHGMSRYSRDNYVRYARRLIQSLQMSDPDWTVLSAQHISDFVRREAARLKPGSCRQPVTSIRALLRFLVAEGVVPPNLHRAIPVIRVWRHTSLPQHISTEELVSRVQIPLIKGIATNGANVGFEADLFLAADKLRKSRRTTSPSSSD
jgi:site-specific recombinase XerD